MAAQTTRRFIWRENEDTGLWGWRLKGMDHFDPFTRPLAVWHDAVEHLHPANTVIDAFADEMQALGSMLFTRYEVGVEAPDERFSRPYQPHDLAYELIDFIRTQYEQCGESPERIGRLRTKHLTRIRLDPGLEEFMAEALRKARLDLPDEIGNQDGTLPDDLRREWPALARRIQHWMRLGYRRFTRRWDEDGGCVSSVAYHLCTEVKRQMDRMTLVCGGDAHECNGAEMTIRFRPGTRALSVKIKLDGGESLEDW